LVSTNGDKKRLGKINKLSFAITFKGRQNQDRQDVVDPKASSLSLRWPLNDILN